MTDKNGNKVAAVVGGPDDGDTFFIQDAVDGDTFVPINDGRARPIYRLDGERWLFVGFEPRCPEPINPSQ